MDRKISTPTAPKLTDMYGNPIASNRGAQGTYQIRILIPKKSSSFIIGKGGVGIKRIMNTTESNVQLGEDSDPYNTQERTVTINSSTVKNCVLVKNNLFNYYYYYYYYYWYIILLLLIYF